MKQFEAELLKGDWTQVRPEVEIKKVAIPQSEETYILCRTSGRKKKEKAIRNRFSNSVETALNGPRNCGPSRRGRGYRLTRMGLELSQRPSPPAQAPPVASGHLSQENEYCLNLF
jgi:hypothetical protein